MFFGNDSGRYILEGATREVPYNGSFITVADLRDIHEIVSPWYNVVAGESTVGGRCVLVAVALRCGTRSVGKGTEYVCEPIRSSEVDTVRDRLERYRKRQQREDMGILVLPELSQI